MASESNLEQYRSARGTQESARRTEIIDASEALFLEKGIAGTTMLDVAERSGVSRVTVYRYFSDRDHLSLEVGGRMLGRLAEAARAATNPEMTRLEAARAGIAGLVARFDDMREVHRFLAMLDNFRPYRQQTEELSRWYADRAQRAFAYDNEDWLVPTLDRDTMAKVTMLTNTVLAILGRFAVGGCDIDDAERRYQAGQLRLVEQMILDYFDTSIEPRANAESH